MRKPILQTEISAKTGKKYEWSDWTLFELDAQGVSPDEGIVIPSFEELADRGLTNEQEGLLRKLAREYDQLKAAGMKKMNTPINDDSDVPGYAR